MEGSSSVSRVILHAMSNVSSRDLRSFGGDIVDRVERGEHITITRSGRPVATLRPVRKPALHRDELLARVRQLPDVDPDRLRRDLDELIDPWL